MGTTIIILTFCMSFAIYLGTGTGTIFTQLIGLSQSTGTLYTGIMVVLGIGVASAVTVGFISFPNPYALFGLFAGVLLGFFTFPVDLITSTMLPTTIKLFVGGVFAIMYIMAIIGWYHGGAEP